MTAALNSERPDIVLVNRNDKYVIIGSLYTVPFEPNIDKARIRKVEKYSPLSSDIEEKGYTCKLICFEVGSRGLITKGNKQNISTLLRAPGQPVKVKEHIIIIIIIMVYCNTLQGGSPKAKIFCNYIEIDNTF